MEQITNYFEHMDYVSFSKQLFGVEAIRWLKASQLCVALIAADRDGINTGLRDQMMTLELG